MIKYTDYWHWNKEISHKNCQKIIKLGKGKWEQAETFGSATKNYALDNTRKSNIAWIEEQWVYDLIWNYMLDANEQAGWKYDIVAAESCQVTQYNKNGFYSWHRDGNGLTYMTVHNEPDNKFLDGNTRKLSMSIILNSDFEGGEFEMSWMHRSDNKVPRLNRRINYCISFFYRT